MIIIEKMENKLIYPQDFNDIAKRHRKFLRQIFDDDYRKYRIYLALTNWW